jgi:hypothetical protein
MDPFVRPPLAYDYRTLIYRSWVPEGPAEFLAQRDPGNGWRAWGAPPVWGVPYQWGAMLMGGMGPLSLRFAGMNSAPSSEPDDWYELDVVEKISWVAGVQAAVTAGLSLGASFQHGPFMETPTSAPPDHPGYMAAPTYDQTMFSADATFARGRFVTRAEFIHDAWEIPNLADDVVELAYSVETQMDLAAGLSAALRWGRIDFIEYAGVDWDWDVDRYEGALGYRFAMNAGILSSYALTRDAGPVDADDDLLSVRLWWAF